MSKILVTTYMNPDLDGTASILAYAELLKSQGEEAEGKLFGAPQPEVLFFSSKLGYSFPIGDEKELVQWDSLVIVDTSSTKRLSKQIDPKKVVEIIDHHPAETGEEFPVAKIQNEEVGATATLVYERIEKAGLELEEKLANLIYLAIFHNSTNLLSGADERDLRVISELEKKYGFKREAVGEMFDYASSYILDNFEAVVLGDLKEIETVHGLCVAGQIELYDAFSPKYEIVAKSKAIVEKLKAERGTLVLMMVTDIKENRTGIYTDSPEIQEALSKSLGLTFSGGWAYSQPMTKRKKVLNLLKKEG